MYNTQIYNLGLYNGTFGANAPLISNDKISFNGFSLSNGSTIVASSIFVEEMARDFIYSQIPRGNGRLYQNSFYRNKQINIVGNITTATTDELEALIFEFKKQIYAPQGYLDYIQSDGTRVRYIATLSNDDPVQRGLHWHLTTTPFRLTFDCTTPFGQETVPKSESALSSDLIFTASLNNDGNAEAKSDVIMIVNAASSVSVINFNNTTSKTQIQLNETISAGDIVVFSAKNNNVTINGVEKDFSGTFITANVGSNNYTLTVTGSSVEYELTINTPINYI